MSVTTQKERAFNSLHSSVLTNRLGGRGNMCVVECAIEARPTMPRRPKGYALRRIGNIRRSRVVRSYELRDVLKIRKLGGLTGTL